MKRFLVLLFIVVVSSCSTLPKLAQENPDCWTSFDIRPMGSNWIDIRTITDESKISTKPYPSWYESRKSVFDGCNVVYFNPYCSSFIGLKYGCENYEYTEKIMKTDQIKMKKYCLKGQSEALDSPQYNYNYSIPQNLLSEKTFESSKSFSVYEELTEQKENDFESGVNEAVFGPIPELYRLTVFGDYNSGKAAYFQIALLTNGSETAMGDFKSIAASLSFPKR